ncbi:MAG: trehalose-phosphatase [Bryobacteraceae bacterium]
MLSVFARSNALVAFDFDGTLAPIVRNPDEACMRPQTKTLLKRLCSLYPCMVISGRSRLDVRSRLRGTALRYVIGNHGAELGDTRKLRNLVSGWKALLAPALAGFAGVWIEDKQLSLAIHYRQSSQKVGARKKIFRLAQGLRGAKLIPAKQALNVIPKAAPHKGMALETLRTKLRCDTALYVGDDVTDEDVFSLKLPEGFLGIRVGVRRASLARFCLYQQSEIDDLLRLLAELRESSTSGHGKLLSPKHRNGTGLRAQAL